MGLASKSGVGGEGHLFPRLVAQMKSQQSLKNKKKNEGGGKKRGEMHGMGKKEIGCFQGRKKTGKWGST